MNAVFPRSAVLLSLRCMVGAAAIGCALPASAAEQTFPTRLVRIVVPLAPGGGTDNLTRIMAPKLSEVLGQQVIVDNRPGAGGQIGSELVAKAAPDGYTILNVESSFASNPSLFTKLPYDTLRDFDPIALCVQGANVLVIHPSLPAKNVKELIALAKSRPGQINYASSGNGSTQHLTGALFCKMAGISMTHIPYRGSGPVTADLIGGQVQVGFPGIAGMLPHIKAGKLRALGVTSAKRSPELPDVPTIAEAGVKDYEMVAWFGIAAPKALPRDIQTRLQGDLLKVLKTADMQRAMRDVGQEVAYQEKPEQFFEFMKREAAKWAKVVHDSGAKVE
jgi:tripartite-type tricarboxylate transporter receptor subunit TctC